QLVPPPCCLQRLTVRPLAATRQISTTTPSRDSVPNPAKIPPQKRKVPPTPAKDSSSRPKSIHRSTRSSSSVPDSILWPSSISSLRTQGLVDDVAGTYNVPDIVPLVPPTSPLILPEFSNLSLQHTRSVPAMPPADTRQPRPNIAAQALKAIIQAVMTQILE